MRYSVLTRLQATELPASSRREPAINCTRLRRLSARNSEAPVQFVDQQAAARLVGLEPLAIDHQLRNGALAHAAHDLGGSGRVGVHVDLGVLDAVCIRNCLAARQSGHQIVAYNCTFIEGFYCKSRCYDL